jgi:hypothetical protein
MFGIPEIRPYEAARFHDGEGRRLQALPQTTVSMVRRIQDRSIHGKLPAVIYAADAALFDTTYREARAAMHAPFFQDTHISIGVTEHDEPLT